MPPTPRVVVAITSAPAAALPGHLSSLRGRLGGLRRKYVTVTLAHGVLFVLGTAAAILAGEMGLDWLVDLPWVMRLLIFLGMVATVGWFAWLRLVLPWKKRPGENAMALMIERAMPIFRGRYIASLQLARDGASVLGGPPALVRALVAQTTALASDRKFGHVVSTARLQTAVKRTLLGVVALGAFFYFTGGSGVILLKRAFLFNDPVPTKTRVVDATGDRIVAIGDDLQIEATAAGIVPGKPGRLIITELAKNTRSEFPFEPVPDKPARFGRLVTSVQGPFDYQIRLGDGRSAVFHVTTRPRPGVAALEVVQVYPPYVHRPPVKRSLNDLKILAGSHLQLRCQASVDVKAGSVRLSGGDHPATVPMKLEGTRELTADVPIPSAGVSGFSVAMVDPDGIETRDPTVYRIDLLPDQPPTVKIIYPDRREELVTAHARLLLAFEATDDLGIAKLLLHYKVTRAAVGATPENVVENAIEMSLDADQPRELRRRYEWKIGDLKPPIAVGTTVEYWLEVFDANDVSGPGIGLSEHFTARVVTDQEKLADVMNRTSDTIVGFNEQIATQEEITKRLGTIINDRAAGAGP